jgi:hypothetical protein
MKMLRHGVDKIDISTTTAVCLEILTIHRVKGGVPESKHRGLGSAVSSRMTNPQAPMGEDSERIEPVWQCYWHTGRIDG